MWYHDDCGALDNFDFELLGIHVTKSQIAISQNEPIIGFLDEDSYHQHRHLSTYDAKASTDDIVSIIFDLTKHHNDISGYVESANMSALNNDDGNSGQEIGTIAAGGSNDGQFWAKNLEQVHSGWCKPENAINVAN